MGLLPGAIGATTRACVSNSIVGKGITGGMDRGVNGHNVGEHPFQPRNGRTAEPP